MKKFVGVLASFFTAMFVMFATLYTSALAQTTWTGVVVDAVDPHIMKGVSCVYTVPTLKLGNAGSVYTWPGLGGMNNDAFQQNGTLSTDDETKVKGVRRSTQYNYQWLYLYPQGTYLMDSKNVYNTSFASAGDQVRATLTMVPVAGGFEITSKIENLTRGGEWTIVKVDKEFSGMTAEWFYELSTGKPVLADDIVFSECKYQMDDGVWYSLGDYCEFARPAWNYNSSGAVTVQRSTMLGDSFTIKRVL